MDINRTPEPMKALQYDWKHLGLLAANAIFDCSYANIIDDERVNKDECLRQLIHEGKSWLYIYCCTISVWLH